MNILICSWNAFIFYEKDVIRYPCKLQSKPPTCCLCLSPHHQATRSVNFNSSPLPASPVLLRSPPGAFSFYSKPKLSCLSVAIATSTSVEVEGLFWCYFRKNILKVTGCSPAKTVNWESAGNTVQRIEIVGRILRACLVHIRLWNPKRKNRPNWQPVNLFEIFGGWYQVLLTVDGSDKFVNGFYKSDRINGPEEAVGTDVSPPGSVSTRDGFLLPAGNDVGYVTKNSRCSSGTSFVLISQSFSGDTL